MLQVSVDFHDAGALLQSSYHKLKTLPFGERASPAAKVGASNVLQWVTRRDPGTWDVDVSIPFADFLGWHLEAERLQGSSSLAPLAPDNSSPITEWLDQACAQRPQDPTSPPLWASRVLSSHVKALLYWHDDLEFALQAMERYTSHIHCGRALGYLHDALTGCHLPTEDHGTWKVSTDSFERYLKLPISDRRRAAAMLYHPEKPDARPLIGLHQKPPDTTEDEFGRYRGRRQHYARAAEVLQAQGMLQQASVLAQAGESVGNVLFRENGAADPAAGAPVACV